MPSRYGLTWQGKRDGKLDKPALPSEDYERHYILDGPTKTQSSYPVVDSDGYLRRENVKLAWDMRGHADSKKSKVAKVAKYLGGLFDTNPLPDDAYEQEMTQINVHTLTFAEYQYNVDDWVEWSWDGADVYGQVRDRTKDSFTVDGNEIAGDDGENVYKMEEYDTDGGEFTGQMVAKPESSLSSWNGPQNSSDIEGAALTKTFAIPDSQKQSIYEMWQQTVNMSEEQMEMWDDSPCADAGVMGGEDVRDEVLMLMGQAPEGWNEDSYRIANRHLMFIENHRDEMGEDAMEGGQGTCPAPMAVEMLNRGVNPFDMMPAGNPNFGEASVELDLPAFEEHGSDELDEVYSEWDDHVNMTASQLESWAEHSCADEASRDPEAVRERNMRLLETDKSDWTQDDIDDAKRTISFISRMRGQRPDSPAEGGPGTCPSEWAISLLNWAYNPFESMPDGDPNPGQENVEFERNSLTFAASVATPNQKQIGTDFNEYGIRKNYDDNDNLVSVDAVFEAMEPGPPENRNGVRITKDFLKRVANKDYSDDPPFLMDHTKKTISQVGFVKDVWFNDAKEKLMVMARAYNTGSQTHDEIISRLTFDPPTIQDGSVGLSDNYDFVENQDGEVELTDGKIKEFSTTPFPGGYDEGGLRSSA